MMPSKMVIATILSSAARAIAIFLLSLLLKLNDDLYWVLPWLRQMTIRIEVVFFIFLIQCGGSSRGAPSIHVASLSPTRVYCFHFNCAIVVAAAASKAAAGGMVETGSNAYILVPWLAAAARVALGAAVAHSMTARILVASLQCSLVNCWWYSDQICESSFFKRAQRNLAPLCNRFNSMLSPYKNNKNNRKNAFT